MQPKSLVPIFIIAMATSSARSDDVFINEIMYHPLSENPLEEYVELSNKGTAAINITGWHFTKGIDFVFPSGTILPGGYLVVAADLATFHNKYPSIVNVVGNWEKTLASNGEELELDDAAGKQVDNIHYANEGDWATRARGPLDNNHQGWVWVAGHDGGGKSLELINSAMPNKYGQNWASSITAEGTPGQVNSVSRPNIAPIILEVSHFPVIPRSSQSVTVTARVLDEHTNGISAILHYRLDGPASFSTVTMSDDGAHGDGLAGDGFYGATLPPQVNNSVVEFYIEVRDLEGNTRTWPGPVQPAGSQSANLLYQVSETNYAGPQPLYVEIMTELERSELEYIGGNLPDGLSNAQMNGTFISIDELGIDLHYTVGIRNRGHGSRTARPNNYKVIFPDDHLWKGVSRINVNAPYTHAVLAGSIVFRNAGLAAGVARAVQLRVNNADLATPGLPMFGSYLALETLDSAFLENHFPADPYGNLYRGIAAAAPSLAEADLSYRGSAVALYTNTYFKYSNKTANDWSDLIELMRVLSQAPTNLYVQEINRVLDVNEWLNYFAINSLVENNESGIYMGYGNRFALYRGTNDTRFQMVPLNLETIIGQGNVAGTTNASIFRAMDIPVLARFLQGPEFLPLYYAHLRGLIETTLSPGQFNPMLDAALSGFVPAATIADMKTFTALRNAYVLTLLPPLVSITNVWRYNQAGLDLGTAWREVAYSDGSWPSGKALLYNETATLPAPKSTLLTLVGQTTYYFRTHFAFNPTFTNAGTGLRLKISTVIDDGAVIYLNGAEVFRLGMADGPVTASTLANRLVPDAVWEGSFGIPPDHLVVGDNVLAVEVHQVDPGSSDITFGMTLDVAIEPISKLAGVVVVNEVMANNVSHPDANNSLADWVELYNKSPNDLDLSDASLTASHTLPRNWVFPPMSIIRAHGFMSLRCDNNVPASASNTGFALKKTGDQVYFFDKPANGGGLLDSVSFGLQAPDLSIGRVPDGAITWLLNVPTKQAANVPAQLGNPLVLKVNEWMANPSVGSDWFEICNPQANPVDLSELVLSDNVVDRTQSRIPALSFIAGGAQGFQKFDADGSPSKGADHANFKLSSSGESIVLFTAAGAVIDSVTFGAQQADVSQGRYPDGSATVIFLPGSETPGTSNSLAQRQQIILSGNNVLIHFYGYSANSYTVQYRNSLSSGAWTKLQNVFPSANGPVQVVDPIPAGNQARFYRLVTPATP